MKNRQPGRGRHRQSQSGIALLTVMFALILISAIAFGMMYMANTETVINANFRDLQKAQYGAWSGIHEARGRLISTAPSTSYLGTATSKIPSVLPDDSDNRGITYILNPASGETVDPSSGTYADTELCHEGFNGLSSMNGSFTAGVPCASNKYPGTGAFKTATSLDPSTGTAYALPYKWVRITMKSNNAAGGDASSSSTSYYAVKAQGYSNSTPICWNGSREIPLSMMPNSGGVTRCEDYVSTNPNDSYLTTVYMLTALGVTSTGARRMVQMETAFSPPFASNAAVASNDNVTLNGALTVSGYDNCSCTCDCINNNTGAHTALTNNGSCGNNETYNCTTRAGSTTTCQSKYGIYAQGSIQNPTGANENVYSESVPAYSGGHTDFPYSPSALVQAYSSLAGVVNVSTSPSYNWSCTSSGCGTHASATFGTYPPSTCPQPGDATFNTSNPACTTYQITYIPGGSNGATTLTSAASGAGVLLVQGDLNISGGLQFYGLIIVTGSVHFSGGGSDPTNIYGAIISGQPVIDTTTLGGSANIHYDACALSNQFKGQPPSILASRELPY
jgi:hypothetical protein